MHCLLVDDEPLALDVLAHYVAQTPGLTLTGRCRTAMEAFEVLSTQPVDLLLCDIRMPRMSGLQLVQNLARPPLVVFTTAYRDYAVDSYDAGAVDYLVKPIRYERFLKAVARAAAVHRMREAPQHTAPAPQPGGSTPPIQADAASTAAPEPGVLHLRADKKVYMLRHDEIVYVESLTDYVRVHCESQRVTSYLTITALSQLLPAAQFLRIHRSYLVALRRVRAFSAHEVDLGEGLVLPIGRSHKDAALAALRQGLPPGTA